MQLFRWGKLRLFFSVPCGDFIDVFSEKHYQNDKISHDFYVNLMHIAFELKFWTFSLLCTHLFDTNIEMCLANTQHVLIVLFFCLTKIHQRYCASKLISLLGLYAAIYILKLKDTMFLFSSYSIVHFAAVQGKLL